MGTGLAVAIPDGFAGLVLPRSGLAARHGIALVNAPGLIDSGYRGEVRVLLLNTDRTEPFEVAEGDRIAQLVLVRAEAPELEEAEELGRDRPRRGRIRLQRALIGVTIGIWSSVETVTIVITDLVGSTGLASRVGPAVADELRHEHFALLRDGIEESGGREVKNMGDGLMFVFPSTTGAVDCAIAHAAAPGEAQQGRHRAAAGADRHRHGGGHRRGRRLLRHADHRGGAAVRQGRRRLRSSPASS